MKKVNCLLALLTLANVSFASSFGERLPVYHVVDKGLSSEQVKYIQGVLSLPQLKADEHGALRYTDNERFLSLPTKKLPSPTHFDSEDVGDIVYEGFDFDAISKIRVPDLESSSKLISAILSKANALPETAQPLASHTRFEAVTKKDQVIADLAIDTTVSYTFHLGDFPLEGPGAKIRAAIGPDGKITQFTHAYRNLKKGEEVNIVDKEEAVNRCKTWTSDHGANSRKKFSPSLAYYAPALSEKTDRIVPGIRCEAVDVNGASNQIYFVPAAVDASPAPVALASVQKHRGLDKLFDFNLIQPAHAAFGRRDVGSEGTGPCSGLPHTALNIASFNNRMTSDGVAVQFSWLDANAWEQDWKDPSFSGNDHNWVDDVDMSYWQGHGSPNGFSFSGCSANDDSSLSKDDALWGNRNVEWISLFTCLILAEESGGQRWWQRWGGAFDRLHQINSFDTVSYHSSQHGGIFSNYMLKNNPMTVRQAWAQASIDDQPAQVIWATMGVISNGALSNFNDHFWGKGSVGPDIPANQKQGYWRLSGSS